MSEKHLTDAPNTGTSVFTVYTTSTFACPYCVRAKAALTAAGYDFEERDVADVAVKSEMLERRPSARTVPQIFLRNGYHIGGCDDLLGLMEAGTLDVIVGANT